MVCREPGGELVYLTPPWNDKDLHHLLERAPLLGAYFAAELLNEVVELHNFINGGASDRHFDRRWKARVIKHLSGCPPYSYGGELYFLLRRCLSYADQIKKSNRTSPTVSIPDCSSVDPPVKRSRRAVPVTRPLPQTVQRPRPPMNAELFLHLLLPDDRVEDAVGDLDERFGKKVVRLGLSRAKVWYCKQVACSLAPYVKAALGRACSGATLRILRFILQVLGQNNIASELMRARTRMTKHP